MKDSMKSTRLRLKLVAKRIISFFDHRYYTLYLILFLILARLMPIVFDEADYSHLVETEKGDYNDKIYAVQLASQLSKMGSLFDLNYAVNFPLGESIWNWQLVTQLMQVLILFCLSHLFSAELAVFGLQLLAVFVSLVSVRFLGKSLGLRQIFVNFLSLLFILSPATDLAFGVHTSALFYALPLLSYAFAINFVKNPFPMHFFRFFSILTFTAFVDGYHFQFALLGSFIILGSNLSTLQRNFVSIKFQTFFYLISLTGLISYGLLIRELSSIRQPGSRPLQITPLEVMPIHSTNLLDILVPQQGTFFERLTYGGFRSTPYLGIFFVLLLIMTFIQSRQPFRNFSYRCVAILCVFSLLSSTVPIFHFWGLSIYNVSWINRFLLPGVLYHSRWAQISVLLLMFLLVIQLQMISDLRQIDEKLPRHKSFRVKRRDRIRIQIKNRLRGKALVMILLFSMLIDWNPLPAGGLVRVDTSVNQMKAIVGSEPFLSLPKSVQGRSWIFGALLNAPTVNGVRDMSSVDEAEFYASQGDVDLQRYMISRQTRFLITVMDGAESVLSVSEGDLSKEPDLKRKLNERYFEKLETISLRMYEGKVVTFSLFEVKK